MKPTEDLCDFIESLVENEDIVAIIDPLHYEVADNCIFVYNLIKIKIYVLLYYNDRSDI